MAEPYAPPYYVNQLASQETPRVNSDDDSALLATIAAKYKALAPHMANAAVVQSPVQWNDGRQLEFYHPQASDNPVPGKMTFELFNGQQGAAREDAVAADALHYLGGRQGETSGPPVDPKWWKMREELWAKRPDYQRRIDEKAYREEAEPGDTPEKWANRNRKDAYVRAGLFPEGNPEWYPSPQDPEPYFTPEQMDHFAKMADYLHNGDGATALYSARQADASRADSLRRR